MQERVRLVESVLALAGLENARNLDTAANEVLAKSRLRSQNGAGTHELARN